MDELKVIIGKNIIELRKQNGMTQAELAEKLNYSDKAVSKWECGDAVPDISVLKMIAELMGVTVDYLIHETHETMPQPVNVNDTKKRNKIIITALSASLVWLIVTFLFIILDIFYTGNWSTWLLFLYAVPATLVVLLVFNSIWGNTRKNYAIVTALIWSVLAALYCSLLEYNLWLIFILGVPSQIIVILWSGIRKH